MEKERLLLLEDDPGLIDGLAYTLKKEGYELTVARTVQDARTLLFHQKKEFDLLLLDVALPDGTGYEICEQIRRSGNQAPILFLTAADEEMNIIRGLDSGGDDYLTKPFRLGELCSRIRALLRRRRLWKESDKANLLHSGPIHVNLDESRAWKEDMPLSLTATEYSLLCLFLRKKGRILKR